MAGVNRRKKIGLRSLFVALMALVLVVVGSATPALAKTASHKGTSPSICFVEIVENDAFDAMMTGFKEQMHKLGYTPTYEVKNAQGDMATLNQIAAQLKSQNFDLIVPIATPAAQACVNANIVTPMVFISVTDPVSAGLLTTFEYPDKHMTGTSNKTPVKDIYHMGTQLVPALAQGKLGILYCAGEKNSQVTVEELTSYLDQAQQAYEIKTIQNSSEAKQAASALAASCKAIFVPMDSVVQSAMSDVASTAQEMGVPILGSDPVMVRSGALLSIACSNTKIGAYSANLAAQLLEGKAPSEVAALDVTDNDVMVNEPVLEALGLLRPSQDKVEYFKGDGVVATQVVSAAQENTGSQTTVLAGKAALLGLEYGLLAVGVYITFRILNLADLTVDGSFCLGACVSAVMVVMGHPLLGLILGTVAGALAGSVTGGLIVRAKVNPLLAGIITMTGLYSVNTFILGGPNVSLLGAVRIFDTVAATLGVSLLAAKIGTVVLIDVAVVALLIVFFRTESGLAMRATGDNEVMCRASSINTKAVKVYGLALANACVGLSGALIAQYQGFADVSSGIGMVMVGLASVIMGEVFGGKRSFARGMIMAIAGSVIYRLAIQAALAVNLIDASALKLITSIIVGGFMAAPAIKEALVKKGKLARIHKTAQRDTVDAPAALDLTDISKTFNPGTPLENKVLRGVDLTLQKGEFACLVGSNGAGKSTLFNAIAGSILPDTGQIVLCGKDFTQTPDYKRARVLSRVFQDPMQGTASHLTVAENIALAYGRSKGTQAGIALTKETRAFIYEELKRLDFGLEKRMDTQVGLLSGGQRQAVTLLMATIGNPELLLLDEHTAALDPKASAHIMQLTQKICREKNITTLMITHNLEQSLTFGNRTLVMDKGKIVANISGEERLGMNVEALLDLFKQTSGHELSDDKILLEV